MSIWVLVFSDRRSLRAYALLREDHGSLTSQTDYIYVITDTAAVDLQVQVDPLVQAGTDWLLQSRLGTVLSESGVARWGSRRGVSQAPAPLLRHVRFSL